MLAVGWGDVVGQNTFVIHYENKPLVVNNLTASYTGSLTVPHGYFLGLTGDYMYTALAAHYFNSKATTRWITQMIMVTMMMTAMMMMTMMMVMLLD